MKNPINKRHTTQTQEKFNRIISSQLIIDGIGDQNLTLNFPAKKIFDQITKNQPENDEAESVDFNEFSVGEWRGIDSRKIQIS